jgi:hypothetical protein
MHMRPSRTTVATLAAVLSAATLAAPASARPIDSTAHPARTHSTYTLPRDFHTADARDAAAGRGTFNSPDVTVIEVPRSAPSVRDGVDWTDTALGAAGAAALLAISLAGATTLRRRQGTPSSGAAVS